MFSPIENTKSSVVHWYAEGLYTKERKPGSEIAAEKVYRVEEGDFVYNRLFAWKGSFAIATRENHGCYVSNEFPCFTVIKERLVPQFLRYYFSRETAWMEAFGLSTGGTPTSRNRLKEEKLLGMSIPLPSLPEQLRIVAKVEELAAKVAVASGLRAQATGNVGHIVAAETTRVFNSLGLFPSRQLRELGEDGTNPIQTGPFGAQLHASEFVSEGVPVLNVGNVDPGGLILSYLDHVLPEKASQLSRYSLRQDDLLFARSGATLGKVCPVPLECDGWLMTGHLFRVRFDKERCLPSYAFVALRGAQSVRDQVFAQVRGATRPGFNTTLLSNVCLPIPPIPEQRRIVTYLDDLQAKVDALKTQQAQSAAELDALLPSILDKAFKGEL